MAPVLLLQILLEKKLELQNLLQEIRSATARMLE
jgi:hypothetical protein